MVNLGGANTVWKPPNRGWWKVNTDAAIASGRVGLGMIVSDCEGDVVMSGGSALELIIPAKQAEARASLFGLRYAYDAGYRKVVLESDCSTLVELLKGNSQELSATQMIVKDILSLANLFEACTFNFAKRLCKRAAHAIAKASLTFVETLVWMDECPPDVIPIVLEDKALIE